MEEEMPRHRKPIPEARDRAQARALAWIVGLLLLAGALAPPFAAVRLSLPLWPIAKPLLFSIGFAAIVYALRAATPMAALLGLLICFILGQSPAVWSRYLPDSRPHLLIPAFVALFLLTYAATKFGRVKKEARGLSESRRGRQTSQIIANLGVAGLFAAAGQYHGCIAALAEATADTVSSEIGQATGHPARLITTGRSVPPGTDGGITLVGTAAGLAAAAVVTVIGAWHHPLWPTHGVIWLAAAAGLFFDSFLGATIERKGRLGNDLVNFTSTLLAALLASALR